MNFHPVKPRAFHTHNSWPNILVVEVSLGMYLLWNARLTWLVPMSLVQLQLILALVKVHSYMLSYS